MWELTVLEPELLKATGTLAQALIDTHISPKEGEIWGTWSLNPPTLVRGKEERITG
jgi:hypothetical protein